MSTTWYGKSGVKELDALIDKKPRLNELLLNSQFISELKAFNSKLLDYVSSTPTLMGQAIEYITTPPNANDSEDRKYKLPLLAIEMIETQTTCILNTFFKDTTESNIQYFDTMFTCLSSHDILPMLAGYVFRVCLCLMNNRQKQTIERVYSNPKMLTKMINHANHMAMTNILQLFLNLDTNKCQIPHTEEKMTQKINVLQSIITRIQTEHTINSLDSATIIENLCSVLVQTIEKYYLIVDGKQMMEVIVGEKCITTMMGLLKSTNHGHAFSACNFFISLINYYSFSSFNVDELSSEAAKKNLERLQSQPMIVELTSYFSTAVEKIMEAPTITLNYYRLLEVLCHCISISSIKILQCIRKTKFLPCLINLLFKHEHNNILHMLIEKSFLHLFISDRKIYKQYQKHLFCEIDVIQCTAGRFLKAFNQENIFNQARKKAYFGHFMRILKIYSGIQTLDEDIVAAIKAKTEMWNKITKVLIVPYENIYEKKLGTYENVTEPIQQEFKVGKNLQINNKTKNNSFAIKQIQKQETVPKKSAEPDTQKEKQYEKVVTTPSKPSMPAGNLPPTPPSSGEKSPGEVFMLKNRYLSQSNVIDYGSNDKQLKKSESFKEFMSKKKVQAEHEIKMKRSLSQERKLSGQKAKITSSSPSKKNGWKEQPSEDNNKSDSRKPNPPKIPLSKKNSLNMSSISQRRAFTSPDEQPDDRSNKSMVNMSQLKKIKVYQIEKPKEKKFRRIEDKDKLLLEFLGLVN